jgi:hypothetical protein
MRADTHDGPEQMLHLEAEYIVAALTFVDLKRHLAPRGRAIHHGTSRHFATVQQLGCFKSKADIDLGDWSQNRIMSTCPKLRTLARLLQFFQRTP